MTLPSVLLALALWFDVFGYDAWIPKEGSVASASVVTNAENECNALYTITKYDEDVAYDYYQEAPWCKDNAVLKNAEQIALAREIASAGASRAAALKQESAQIRSYTAPTRMEPSSKEEVLTSVYVTWNLANGRKASRQYYIPTGEMKGLYQKLFDDPSYKEYLFPALTLERADITAAEYEEWGNKTMVPDDQKDAVLDAYFEELAGQTFAERGDEFPVGVLRLHLSEEFTKTLDLSEVYSIEGTGDIYLRYPVYRSFEKTAELLRAAGADPGNEFAIPEGVALNAQYDGYDEKTDSYFGYTDVLTDPEDLLVARENLRPMEYTYYNTFSKGYISENLTFYYDNGKVQKYLGLPDTPECRAFADRISEQLRDGDRSVG